MSSLWRFISFSLLATVSVAVGFGWGARPGVVPDEDERRAKGRGGVVATPPIERIDRPAVARARKIADGDVLGAIIEIAEQHTDGEAQNRAWIELVSALDLQGLRLLIEAVTTDQLDEVELDHLDEEVALFVLADRWAELDANGMMAELGRRLEADDADDDWFLDLTAEYGFFSLGVRCPEKALALVNGLRGEAAERAADLMLGELALMGLATSDPVAAIEATLARAEVDFDVEEVLGMMQGRWGEALDTVLAAEDGDLKEDLLGGLFEGWLSSDPRGAFLAAEQRIGEPEYRDELMLASLESWIARDPEAALGAWQALDPERRDDWEADVLSSWASADPLAAMTWAMEHSESLVIGSVFQQASGHLESALAADFFARLDLRARRGVRSDFFERYAKEDPVAAMTWLSQVGMSGSSSNGVGVDAGIALAMRGPQAIQDALAVAPAGMVRDELVRTVFEHTAFRDPEAARELLQGSVLNEEERALATMGMVMGIAENDPAAAADLAASHGDEGLVAAAVNQWSRIDAEASYRWLVESVDGDADAVDAVMQRNHLARVWAHQEPLAAAEAMLGLPEDLAGRRLGDVVSIWAGNDQEAAAAFIGEQLEPGVVRDAAVVAMVDAVREEDVNAAMSWAREISDEALMYQTMDSLATE